MDPREERFDPYGGLQIRPDDEDEQDGLDADDEEIDDELEEEEEDDEDDDEDDLVDEASEESFPASDPPSFTSTGIR